MAAGSATRTIRNAGRLVVGPTNLSTAYPHGGTEVGRTQLVVLQPFGEQYRIEGEGIGRATDILEANKRWVFACFLRGWDDDAIDLLMNDGDTVGSVSGHAVWGAPGTRIPGRSALARAQILLYVPDDILFNPAVLVYAAIPQWTPGSEIAFQRGVEMGIPFSAECFEDTNGNTLSIGRFADLSLT